MWLGIISLVEHFVVWSAMQAVFSLPICIISTDIAGMNIQFTETKLP